MPCLAKKHECAIPTVNDSGAGTDIDAVLTTREVGRLLKAEHINVAALQEAAFDEPLGTGSGAGAIFGVTGGVMEAALRSDYYLTTGTNPEADLFKAVRGSKSWKEAEFDLAGNRLKIAVVSSLSSARQLIEALLSKKASYDFVEVMACPGGCCGGGGHPIHEGSEPATERGAVLYKIDRTSKIRFSHENPSIQKCYADYLEKPLSHKAHELLHTDHTAWDMPTGK